jgi:hypothetical protein
MYVSVIGGEGGEKGKSLKLKYEKILNIFVLLY